VIVCDFIFYKNVKVTGVIILNFMHRCINILFFISQSNSEKKQIGTAYSWNRTVAYILIEGMSGELLILSEVFALK